MKVAFLGYGSMAKALAGRFVGFPDTSVLIAGRDTGKARSVAESFGDAAEAASMNDAVRLADAVVIATPHEAVFDAVASAGGPDAFAGRIVVDINNPVPGYADRDFTLAGYHLNGSPGGALSLGEAVQSVLSDAKVVKAFNTAQAKVWTLDPMRIDGQPFTFPICGNAPDAKGLVADWVQAMGGKAVDIGGIEYARQIEAVAAMTIQMLFSNRGPLTVFNLVED